MLVTFVTLAALFGALAFTRYPTDVLFFGAVTTLLLTGVIEPAEAFLGFSHPVIFTLASLYVIAAGLKDCGALHWISHLLLGNPNTERKALLRLLMPAGLLSSVLNNTAVMAMFIPTVQQWAKKLGFSNSRFLMPLSFITILGGMLTLIGTSTNLIVSGLGESEYGIKIDFFAPALVIAPLLPIAAFYLVFFSKKLLPTSADLTSPESIERQYRVAFKVIPGQGLDGKSISEAGLRHLKHGFLSDIERNQKLISGVAPEMVLEDGDVLLFIGGPECASDLRNIRGLEPAEGASEKLFVPNKQRCLSEVVLSNDFPYLGRSVRESAFRTNYNAIVLAVAKKGKKATGKIGDITLEMGDTLLLESGDDFVKQYQYRKDFLLVSRLNNSTRTDHQKAPTAISILALVILLSAFSIFPIAISAMLGAGLMIATSCVTASIARRSVDLTVLSVIGCSFALGTAIIKTGAAASLGEALIYLASGYPLVALLSVYVTTNILTELVTNNAAAILMVPISSSIANTLGVNFEPFLIVVMIAASASFLTPIGYQTNLMVQGPGGYQFKDYFKLGLPITVLCAIGTVVLSPLIWPF
ncbi:SLC13 family permease [Simiduia aestuariiviva]|uniref:Di/tricarboxylate transporter n=1 Tax=Simiduia aestuariiviva TaxID=1510459 RepID=A0A839UJR7_9GAMM|nr:SLC13 family permease [Simiduia aestuariiviva]MBB3168354.1 di/tricarboxylate transporter [Simiduia aestuariiviva]